MARCSVRKHLEGMRHWRHAKIEETASAVREIGAQNFILATDLGQMGNPSPDCNCLSSTL